MSFNMNKLALVLICTLLVCILVFTFAACSHDETNPKNFQDKQQDTQPDSQIGDETGDNTNTNTGDNNGDNTGNTPSGDSGNTPSTTPDDGGNTTPGGDTPVKSEFEQFVDIISNVQNVNATTTITVSFGGRTLSQKVIEYTRSANGGTVKTTHTSLNTADAQKPYMTEEASLTLNGAEFENKFPNIANVINNARLCEDDYTLTKTNQSLNLSFVIAKADVQTIARLTDAETATIATDINIIVSAGERTPVSFTATYKTTNGNTVSITIVYQE